MAIINYSTDLGKTKTLAENIESRDTALGADSPLKNLKAKHGINLANNVTAITLAMTRDVEAMKLRNESEYNIAQRNSTADPVMKTIGSFGQQLKTFYKPEFLSVGLWGFPITVGGKITLPTDPQKRVDLMEAIIEMDATFASGDSPLFAYIKKNDLDLSKMLDELNKSLAFDNTASEKQRASEEKIEQRNQLFEQVDADNRLIGNALKVFYDDSVRELGLWGFNVDESAPTDHEQLTKVLLLSKKTIKNVKIGGLITNMSKFNINIFKGKTVSDTPTVLEPGKPFGIAKGWSTITIYNPSTTETAVVKVSVTGR